MTQITVTIDTTQLQGGLTELSTKLADLSPAMRSIGEYSLRKVRQRFDREVDPEGKPWDKLARSTIKAKARRARTGKPYRTRAQPEAILKDTFTLRDSITYQVTNSSVAIGTNIFYGVFHQSDEPRSKLPQRPFLGVDDEDAIEIVEIIKDYLES